MSRRLLVIGLDGYEASTGDAMMRAGRLPALAAMVASGAHVHLDHGPAKRTGLAWEHFSTGRSPELENRWSAVDFDPVSYRCAQRGTSSPPFLAGLDVPAVVFDAPYFDLAGAPSVRGVVGWGAHDPGIPLQANPGSLVDEVRDRFGEYPATPWIYGLTWPSASRTREMATGLVAATQARASVARWLLTERVPDWSLAVVVVSEIHSAIEALWHGVDETHPLHGHESASAAGTGVRAVYEAVDELIGSLASSCPDTTVLTFSMHGMGANESDVASMALLPELLYRERYRESLLHVDERASSVPDLEDGTTWSARVRRHFPERLGEPASRRDLPGLLLARVPSAVKRRGARLLGMTPPAVTTPLDWMPASWYARFWPHMDAFALPSFYDGQVRLNLTGREARGRVDLQQYDAVCDRVERLLRECVDPRTGAGVVREIHRHGPDRPLTLNPTEADLIVVWHGSPLAFRHPLHGVIGPLPYRRTGGHTGDHGIAYVSGEGIRRGFYGTRSAFDVVPTVRSFFGRPPDPCVSGASFESLIGLDGYESSPSG